MLRVNIYYGGRGLIEDPSIYVMNKLTQVLQELNVEVKRYNLYEDKRGISILPKTLKEADGVILTASVEWFGIGGLMQQFLDACWLYGDKERIRSLYMMPVVTSTAIGEKEALYSLLRAWDILGGISTDGICAYVPDHTDFETDTDYASVIEKRAEDFYRQFTRKSKPFLSSSHSVSENIMPQKPISLTPQESEQLSVYVSNDKYVQTQKQDIEELTHMFQGMLGITEQPEEKEDPADPILSNFQSHFQAAGDLTVTYTIALQDKDRILSLHIADKTLHGEYVTDEKADVMIKASADFLNKLFAGEVTMQTAFLEGSITAKGDFQLLKTFDTLFTF